MVNTQDGSAPLPLGQLLLRAFRWFDESLLTSLSAKGWPELTRAQSLLFAHLDEEGTRSAELARRIGVSRQAVHKTIRGLEELNLVTFEPDPTNKSAKLVVLTEKGRKNVRVALQTFEEIERELADRLGPESVSELRAALEANWGPPVNVAEDAPSS